MEQKEVMRAGIRETKGGDEFEKICGRKNFQDLVIFWICGVKKRWQIR